MKKKVISMIICSAIIGAALTGCAVEKYRCALCNDSVTMIPKTVSIIPGQEIKVCRECYDKVTDAKSRLEELGETVSGYLEDTEEIADGVENWLRDIINQVTGRK